MYTLCCVRAPTRSVSLVGPAIIIIIRTDELVLPTRFKITPFNDTNIDCLFSSRNDYVVRLAGLSLLSIYVIWLVVWPKPTVLIHCYTYIIMNTLWNIETIVVNTFYTPVRSNMIWYVIIIKIFIYRVHKLFSITISHYVDYFYRLYRVSKSKSVIFQRLLKSTGAEEYSKNLRMKWVYIKISINNIIKPSKLFSKYHYSCIMVIWFYGMNGTIHRNDCKLDSLTWNIFKLKFQAIF